MDELLTSSEAAHRLGVKTATLYAYVSRGTLRAHRIAGESGSRFVAADVDALAEHGRSAHRPRGAVETVRSALTTLDGDRLRYRGQDAVELSRTHSFEAVARLLWTGTASTGPFARDDALTDAVRIVLDRLPHARHPARLRVALTTCGALAPDCAPEPLLSTVVGALTERSEPTLAQTLARALGRSAQVDLDLNPALVLLADHGLAVSTVAARVAASARAPLPSVLSAALGAAAGPLHAGASTAAHALLRGRASVTDGPTDEVPPGFGHLVYDRRDPRADELLATLPDGRTADLVADLTERAVRRYGARAFPNVDLALAALVHAHHLPADAGELIFEVGRLAGWVAHALEEREAPDLRFRVRGLHGA